MKKRSSLLLCGLIATGCYTYTPVERPEAGMEVRARLTGDAAARASQGLDEPILRYDGKIVAATADSISIDVLIARASSGLQDITIRDTVSLRRTDLQAVLERKISPSRSALFAVGAAAAAVGVVLGIDQVVGGTGGEDDPNPPPTSLRDPFFVRIPFFQFIAWLTQRQ